MKKITKYCIVVILIVMPSVFTIAQRIKNSRPKTEHVRSYNRRNGTHVNSYYRSHKR